MAPLQQQAGPHRQTPEPFTPLIRPITIIKPVERTYIENAPGRDTGPIKKIEVVVIPQPPIIESHGPVASPTPYQEGYRGVRNDPPRREGQRDRGEDRPVASPPAETNVTQPSPPIAPVAAINAPPGAAPEMPDRQSESEPLPEVPLVRKKKPPKVEEKASDVKPELPEEEDEPPSGRKRRTFNGKGGRIHTEAQIDELLDFYLMTGELPIYVSDRQRYDYRHHKRLPERKELLEQRGIPLKA